jgi:hypothetical protein
MRISTHWPLGKPIRTAVACLSTALMVSSCAQKPQEAIVGKWKVEDNQSMVEYHKDGTMVTSQNGQSTEGKYQFTDDSHMEMEISGSQGTNKLTLRLTCEVAIQGDKAELSMTLPGKPPVTKTIHYTRIK